MSKRIIVLSDGTGNSAAKVWRTNVWRLFESLDLKKSDQIAIYDDGVGTSSFKPMALLGGAFGFGLKRNVLGLYKFLCRNYRSKQDYEELAKHKSVKDRASGALAEEPKAKPTDEPKNERRDAPKDDEIFLFGFSRGAFTVRVLTGLLLSQGLVRFTSESELNRNARAAYRAYRTNRYSGWSLERPFRFMRNLFASHTHQSKDRPVDRIRFIGVWDTVAAYGSPIEEMTRGFSQYIWPLELPDHGLSDRIDRACHALAIDEERTSFAPELWEEPATSPPARTKDEVLSQVWFSGVHSNVGGGYPDDSLANVSLSWMMAEAADCDLRFKTTPDADPDAMKHVNAAQDKDGRLYDSRAGVGGYYRYGPRKIANLYALAKGEQATRPLPKIHESVFARIQVGAHLYAPIGLPDKYAVVRAADRTIQSLGQGTFETSPSAAQRQAAQESVWNVVWRRRATYFLTVFASLYTVVYPLVRESFAYQEMATRLRVVSDTIKLVGAFLPSGATRWPTGYARDPAWFLLWLGVIAFLIWYGSTLKSEINSRMRHIWETQIPGASRGRPKASSGVAWSVAWAAFVALLVWVAFYPIFDSYALLKNLRVSEPGNSLVLRYSEQPMRFVLWAFLIFYFIPERAIEWLRTRSLYQWLLTHLKHTIAPFGFAVLILYGAFALSSHLLFNVRDSFGSFCKHTADAKGPLNAGNTGFDCTGGKCSKTLLFDSSLTDHRSLCMPTGVFAKRGDKYAINVHRYPKNEKWKFWHEPSFLSGQPVSRLEWWKQPLMTMMYPFRRTLDRPWSAFIVRYGPTGTEESFLDRDPPALDDDLVDEQGYRAEDVPEHSETLGEEWRASRDGEIYLYLNKPVLGIWGIETWISKFIPNSGMAQVTIERR
jgi:uncharacterized protein (DUF2235 family)